MARAGKAPQTAKVSDVISNFVPTRQFKPDAPCSITSIDFDDTGELCLVARDDETLQIYNCTEGKHAKELKSQKYGVDIARFAHHPQSIIYASTKGDDAIRYLSSHDNTYIRYFRGHTAPVTSIALNPSSDGFISSSLDNTVRLWDLRSQNPTGELKLTTPYLSAYDPTASVIAVACLAANTVLLYDIRNYDKPPFAEFDIEAPQETLQGVPAVRKSGGMGQWTKLEFSNDGKKLLIATTTGHLLVDAFEGDLVGYCNRPQGYTGRVIPSDLSTLRAQQQAASSKRAGNVVPSSGQGDACLTPDGRYVVGGSGDSDVCVWDTLQAETEPDNVIEPMRELVGGSKLGSNNRVVAYNPRHNIIATADRSLVFWVPDMES